MRIKTGLAALAAALTLAAGAVAPASADTGNWTVPADRAYAESVAAVTAADAAGTYVRAQFVAALAWYAGERFGWWDHRTQEWLHRLYSLRTPSGGYGLGAPFDAFQDGTVNPAGTAYTITEAWHVGRTLIAGYDHGSVPAWRIRQVARPLARAPLSAGGKCPAYSDNPNDAGKPCVWNVAAAAAWFLENAERRGLIRRTPAGTWLDEVRAAYRAELGAWPYQADQAKPLDSWHNVPSVLAMLDADSAFGRETLAGHFRNWPVSGANADLLPYDCARAEVNYAAIRASATQPADTPVAVLQSRAGYAPLLLLVARECG
jgi:hypothetical protein